MFKIMGSQETSEILAPFGFKNLDKEIFTFKIIFISMFFGLDNLFILNELESKENLHKYFNIPEILSVNQVYKTLSFQISNNLMKVLNHILIQKIVLKIMKKDYFLIIPH